jgi:hypothetical protein
VEFLAGLVVHDATAMTTARVAAPKRRERGRPRTTT